MDRSEAVGDLDDMELLKISKDAPLLRARDHPACRRWPRSVCDVPLDHVHSPQRSVPSQPLGVGLSPHEDSGLQLHRHHILLACTILLPSWLLAPLTSNDLRLGWGRIRGRGGQAPKGTLGCPRLLLLLLLLLFLFLLTISRFPPPKSHHRDKRGRQSFASRTTMESPRSILMGWLSVRR